MKLVSCNRSKCGILHYTSSSMLSTKNIHRVVQNTPNTVNTSPLKNTPSFRDMIRKPQGELLVWLYDGCSGHSSMNPMMRPHKENSGYITINDTCLSQSVTSFCRNLPMCTLLVPTVRIYSHKKVLGDGGVAKARKLSRPRCRSRYRQK